MIRPEPCARIARAANRLTSYRPVRSTARRRSHSSRGNWSIVDAVGHRVDARVVDQDVEPAVGRDDPVDDLLDLLGARHVERAATRHPATRDAASRAPASSTSV